MHNRIDHSSMMGRWLGIVTICGGILGVILAPAMVVIKYMTGWSIIPEPAWVEAARPLLESFPNLWQPPMLWTFFGVMYTAALVLMLGGLVTLGEYLKDEKGRVKTKGYWLLVAGFILVIPGDAIHSITWHQNGLTVPTPGTNPLANTAYATHMMGMNFIMLGCLIVGVTSLRKRLLSPWLGWSLIAVLPFAVIASTTVLPTTPSGALFFYCILMMAVGYSVHTKKRVQLVGT